MTGKLEEIMKICDIHLKRLNAAFDNISEIIPVDEDKYYALREEQIAFIDQFIFRFSKLQDIMGERLFKEILVQSDEKVKGMTFRDVLNKMESFGIVSSREEWLNLREIRNSVSHEYPVADTDAIDSLNSMFKAKDEIANVYEKAKQFVNEKLR